MLKTMKVSSRSPGVIQSQMAYHCRMDIKLGKNRMGALFFVTGKCKISEILL